MDPHQNGDSDALLTASQLEYHAAVAPPELRVPEKLRMGCVELAVVVIAISKMWGVAYFLPLFVLQLFKMLTKLSEIKEGSVTTTSFLYPAP